MARDGSYELLCLPIHLSRSKNLHTAFLSVSSIPVSIRSISDPLSMLSFNSNGNESVSVNESSVTDKSNGSVSKATKEIDLWHFRLGHPNVFCFEKYFVVL